MNNLQYPHQLPSIENNDYSNPPLDFNKSVTISDTVKGEYFQELNKPYENISNINFKIIADRP